jgi:signal transduction histidine kinase
VNSVVNRLKTVVKMMSERVALSSLQSRLIFGNTTIFILGLGSVVLWLDWETKPLFMATQQQEMVLDSAKLLAILQSLKLVSLWSLMSVTLISILFIQYVLFPLCQVIQQMENPTNALSVNQINQAPCEVRQLIKQWNHQLVYISEMKEQQRQFIRGAAHELRTPLSLVYGYLQRAIERNQNLTDPQKESLTMAADEAERMTQVLQELLLLARADCGAVPFHLESLRLNDLLVEIAGMAEKFEHHAIRIEADAKPITVKADRRHLMQVLSRLLDNAVKYSPADTSIILKLNRCQDQAVIQVCDSGSADSSGRGQGIPRAQQARIFEPFYRVDPSRTRSTGGVGLGLSIVRALVESMGGSVTVQSKPAQGSTFTLTLPALGDAS